MTVFVALAVYGVAVAAIVAFTKGDSGRQDLESRNRRWEAATRESSDSAAQMYLLARKVADNRYIAGADESPAYRKIREKVTATGLYGGSAEVFLAFQLLGIFAAMAFLIVLLTANLDMMGSAFCLLGAVVSAGLPWNRVADAHKKRSEAISANLPEFAELLQMPLVSGVSTIPALAFTADHIDGPVAEEVRWLVGVLTARSMREDEAFLLAGTRLGTPEATAFFNALGQSYMKGSPVVATLERQSESLRIKSFQDARARMKKIPVKLVVVFAIHLLPLLFAIVLTPVIIGFQGLEG